MTNELVILPAYVDEAGPRGLVRDLKPERDHEVSVMCALLFEPTGHGKAIEAFTPGFNKFRDAMPHNEKLHITAAFKPGNEEWAKVAKEVRSEFIHIIRHTSRPMVVYSARRLRLSRIRHEQQEELKTKAKAGRNSLVKIVGATRPSDWRVEDDLITCLALRLDAFAEDMGSQLHDVKQVDLLFDEIDVAKRYEALIQRTREVSKNLTSVAGWDPVQNKRIEGTIGFKVEAPFRIDTKFLGGIHVVGKEHPLVLAVDIVTNYLAHHLSELPPDVPLNAPSSINEWILADRVWGVSPQATDDIL